MSLEEWRRDLESARRELEQARTKKQIVAIQIRIRQIKNYIQWTEHRSEDDKNEG